MFSEPLHTWISDGVLRRFRHSIVLFNGIQGVVSHNFRFRFRFSSIVSRCHLARRDRVRLQGRREGKKKRRIFCFCRCTRVRCRRVVATRDGLLGCIAALFSCKGLIRRDKSERPDLEEKEGGKFMHQVLLRETVFFSLRDLA